eukprot:TRINITY_DN2240_c0_g1_i1.p1 TRINITY_DN2240_c0_g1~~TRINITY_DN2240_c0_g1_i1.p1  ORF type:complete len:144 (-),score=74.89 TRINITY_DN2240_c0_g1_i1:95-526(-)
MQKSGFLLVVIFLIGVFLVNYSDAGKTKREAAQDLQIDVTFRPEVCNEKTKKNDLILVHYTGRLASNGNVFDSSVNRGEPFRFVVGAGQVIQGWDRGLIGMCPGERRTLTIPPHLGYGQRGAGSVIPPGATLIFETELVAIEK